MTKPEAVYEARKRAKRHQTDYFIVWSVEAHDYMPGEHYHPSSEDDLDTFYSGSPVVGTVQPDGTVEWA